jgi:hypothetical protein
MRHFWGASALARADPRPLKIGPKQPDLRDLWDFLPQSGRTEGCSPQAGRKLPLA